MPAVVNLRTESDADFVRAFVLAQRFPAWAAARLYVTNDVVDHLGQVWTALANSTNIEPSTDALKWDLTARPKIDLTGSQLDMMVRRRGEDIEALMQMTSVASAGISITSAVNGAFTMTLPRTGLAKMGAGDYVHSLIRTTPAGLKEVVWSGKLTHAIGPTR